MADLDRGQVDARALVSARRLRWTIIKQLGLASGLLVPLGCSGSSPGDGDEGGVTTDPSGGEAEGPGTATTLDTADTFESTEDTGDTSQDTGDTSQDTGELKLDVPPDPLCTQEWIAPEDVPAQFPSCEFGPFDPDLFVEFVQLCVELSPGVTCADICDDDANWCEGMDLCWWGEVFESCGVFEQPGACCVVIAAEPLPPIGRPFVVCGEARLAQVGSVGLDSPVAAHWLEMARGEHASIAAFARFVALLQREAAPAQLVADALAAASDEARHTRDALQLASRFAGRPLTLGGLAVTDAMTEPLAVALRAAVLEGCIGETLAAHEAACLADHAKDEQVADILRGIADDEARHAGLAWRFVAWTLEAHPQLRTVVEAAFAQVDQPGASVGPAGDQDSELLAWGCASPTQRARWRSLARIELIRPCAARLLAG